MARKRMIDPSIWGSEDYSQLSTLAKLVFIGLFSNADDEGRGRAKPVYIKSILFPYDEQMRVTDIEKSLQEIAAHMSITFYAHDGTEYYSLDHWTDWQRVDKPTPSRIPAPGEASARRRGGPGDDSRLIEKSRIRREENQERTEERGTAAPAATAAPPQENRSKFSLPPTIAQVSVYCRERGNNVDPQAFVDFYASRGWKVGWEPIRDWRATVRNWERTGGEQERKPPKRPTYHVEIINGEETVVYKK